MSASGGDPTMAWDNFGRLFVAHLTNAGPVGVGVSLDGGATFAK